MRWEVPTMRSATSFFDKTLARSDLRHYWPILFVYSGIWLIGLPVTLWTNCAWWPEEDAVRRAARIILDTFPMAVIMAALFGLLLAMALYSYLMSSRAVGLMHALPIRRETLFFTHFLTGWGMLAAGALLAALVSIPVQMFYGGVAWSALGLWLLVNWGLSLFFMSLATLCAMTTGWLLAVPVLYAAVNFLVIAVAELLRCIGGIFYYGYAGGDDFPQLVYWLTPVMRLIGRLQTYAVARSAEDPAGWSVNFSPEAARAVWIYTAAGAVLLALAWLLYRSRRSEAAADPVAFRWMRPIFRYGVGLIGGLALGLGLYELVLGWRTEDHSSTAQWLGLLICLLLMGVLCSYAAEMVIRKSLRIFRRGLPGALILCAVMLVLCVCARLDVTGYAARVPTQAEVEKVEISASGAQYIRVKCTDAQTVEAALAAHRQILAERPTESLDNCVSLRLRYTLSGGRTLTRFYSFNPDESLTQAVNALLNTPEVREKSLIDQRAQGPLKGGYLNVGDETTPLQLTAEQAEQVYQALLHDLALGHNHMDIGESGTFLRINLELQGSNDYTLWLNTLPGDCTETVAALVAVGAAQSVEDLLAACIPTYAGGQEKPLTSY